MRQRSPLSHSRNKTSLLLLFPALEWDGSVGLLALLDEGVVSEEGHDEEEGR